MSGLGEEGGTESGGGELLCSVVGWCSVGLTGRRDFILVEDRLEPWRLFDPVRGLSVVDAAVLPGRVGIV